MKIILAPSKTRNNNLLGSHEPYSTPLFNAEAHTLANTIAHFSTEQLGKIMKIKDPILTTTHRAFTNFDLATSHPAILSYTGTVFKELKIDTFGDPQHQYMAENLRIMSALYGVLRPYDHIKHYRLDMTMKIMEDSLYRYWKHRLKADLFPTNEPIICLASGEFAKMLPLAYTNIEFKEFRNGQYKTLGTYSKKARGVMANYLIEHLIDDLEAIKDFNLEGYTFNNDLSTPDNFVFTR